jgi:tight adherence protein C
MDFLIYLGTALLIVGIMLVAWAVFGSSANVRLKLPDDIASTYKKRRGYPIFSRLFPFTGKFLERSALDSKMKRRLDAAHVDMTPIEFFNLKITLTFLLAALGFLIQRTSPYPALLGFLFGYALPDIILQRKISTRKRLIVRHLPETVDLLSLCVDAGFDFTTAMKWIIEKTSKNPMVEELAFVLEEIKWGKSRLQAIRDMSRRLEIPEITSFAQTMKQAENMGTPVNEALAMLSEDTRRQRFLRGERTALQAPIKMLVPLIFCILPAIVIVVAAPVLLQFMRGDVFTIPK